MSIASHRALNTYAQLEVETGVSTADPHALIAMLLDGALSSIAVAKLHMARHDVAAKGQAISKAVAIVCDGLKGSLNMEAGGEIAQNLSSLYDYLTQRLLEANLGNDAAALDEVAKRLHELKEGWDGIRRHPADTAPAEVAPAAHRAPVSYGKA